MRRGYSECDIGRYASGGCGVVEVLQSGKWVKEEETAVSIGIRRDSDNHDTSSGISINTTPFLIIV